MTERRRYEVIDLVEVVHELTAPRQHRQSYRAGWSRANRTGAVIRTHLTEQQSLINQLRRAVTHRTDTAVIAARPGQNAQHSLPRFSADAFDRMEAIHQAVAQWCEHLGLPSESAKMATQVNTYLTAIEKIIDASRTMGQPAADAITALRAAAALIRASVEPDLITIARKAPEYPPETLQILVEDAYRWRTWCRVMTGWQDPPLMPYVPCPQCAAMPGERAGLRVRIDSAGGSGGITGDAAVKAAVCLSCNVTWDAETVGLLAEHIRTTMDLGEDVEGESGST